MHEIWAWRSNSEMVNKDSELYRKHPNWIISTPNRKPHHGRNQYVLNFGLDEVVENIFDQMCKLLMNLSWII